MNPVRVREAHTQFKDYLKQKGHSNATILAYGKDIDQLASFLEELEKHTVNEV